MFPGPAGSPLDGHSPRARVWTPLAKKAGRSGAFRMLRHFFVTTVIQSGVNWADVGTSLGSLPRLLNLLLRKIAA